MTRFKQRVIMYPLDYQVERWQRKDWQKGSRHYCGELKQDLFGRWVVVRRWGKVTAVQGQSREDYCNSYEEGLILLSKIERRRLQRGYNKRPS